MLLTIGKIIVSVIVLGCTCLLAMVVCAAVDRHFIEKRQRQRRRREWEEDQP